MVALMLADPFEIIRIGSGSVVANGLGRKKASRHWRHFLTGPKSVSSISKQTARAGLEESGYASCDIPEPLINLLRSSVNATASFSEIHRSSKDPPAVLPLTHSPNQALLVEYFCHYA